MKYILTFFAITTFAMFSSCNPDDPDNTENGKNITLDEKSAKLIEADNAFGLELFKTVRKNSSEQNIMISPLSVSVAFAMVYNGADTDTKAEMEKTMKLNGLTVEQINQSYNSLIKALMSLDKDVVFEIANAIFYAESFSVKSPFLDINKSVYDANISKLNFGSPTSVKAINDWVSVKTHDKISKIIDLLNPLDRMVLLNAIYFNGIWKNKFDEKGTHLLPFTKADGTNLDVPMMKKEEKLEYQENDVFGAIRMPYGTGQYNMIVILPGSGKNSQDIINSLNTTNWTSWMNAFKVTDPVVVTMPRFKFAFETKLNNILTEMGMKKAFEAGVADFSKIANEDLYISSAVHKSYIDVNENGTEAAAVTSITISTTSIGNEPPKIYFNVNKPFVFAITEKGTNAILFIGELNNPEYK